MALWDTFTNWFKDASLSDFTSTNVLDRAEGFLGNIFQPETESYKRFVPYKTIRGPTSSYVGGSSKFPPSSRTYMGGGRWTHSRRQYQPGSRGSLLTQGRAGRWITDERQTAPYTSGFFKDTPFAKPAAIVGGTVSTLRDIVNDYVINPIKKFTESRLGKAAVNIGEKGLEQYMKQQPLGKYRRDGGQGPRGAYGRVKASSIGDVGGTRAVYARAGTVPLSDTLMRALRGNVQNNNSLPSGDLAALQAWLEKQKTLGAFTTIEDIGTPTTTLTPKIT